MRNPEPFDSRGASRNLGKRSDYFSSMQPMTDEDARVTIAIATPPAGLSSEGTYASFNVDESFDLFIAESYSVAQNEAMQPVKSHDSEDMYFFQQVIPILALTGTVYDTPKEWLDSDGNVVPGNGYAELLRFYEKARISQIAKSGNIVRLGISGEVYWGAFITKSASHSSTSEHKWAINLSFLIMDKDRTVESAVEQIPHVDARGRLTAAGAGRVGLLDAEVVATEALIDSGIVNTASLVTAALAGTLGPAVPPSTVLREDFNN